MRRGRRFSRPAKSYNPTSGSELRIPALLVALSLTAAAQDKLYPFAVAQDYLACAPDSSRLNRPLAPARMRTATAGLPIDFHDTRMFRLLNRRPAAASNRSTSHLIGNYDLID